MHHRKQNSHKKKTSPQACLYALKLLLIVMQNQRLQCLQLHNYKKKQTINRMYMYNDIFVNWYSSFTLSKCVFFTFFIVFKFIKNKIQLIVPMVLRENVISVCYNFELSYHTHIHALVCTLIYREHIYVETNIVKRWGDRIHWDNSCEGEIKILKYIPIPFIFTLYSKYYNCRHM